jgi:glycosyltransferase involved in cell wall biosynthesis
LATRVKNVTADDSELTALYQAAEVYVCPSLYEGFGMPVLEAMQNGCSVCCSDSSSLPEVAGSAALYFEARSVSSIAATLEQALVRSDLREQLISAGYARASEFSWRRSAARHLDVYTELMNA